MEECDIIFKLETVNVTSEKRNKKRRKTKTTTKKNDIIYVL